MQTITLTRPDDWHLHLRDDAALKAVLPDTARQFARAIIMPNLRPPVTTAALAGAYRQRITSALPTGAKFEPLMTLYLTDNTNVDDIAEAKASGFIYGIKLYPAGATTNSDSGVTNLAHCNNALAAMEELGMPLLVHAEVTNADVDVFDRERVFIERNMVPLLRNFPDLKVVFEHITTKDAVDFVLASPSNVAATITAHHLLMNRNDMFKGGIQPHHYCLPILKREQHRLALVQAAISGNAKFFLGTDSAPHSKGAKESACGCAGCYSAFNAMGLYAEAFDSVGKLDRLEGFASFFGPDFYSLPRNTQKITLVKQAQSIPKELPFGGETIIPLRAGESVAWSLISS